MDTPNFLSPLSHVFVFNHIAFLLLEQVLAHDSSCGDNGSKLRYSFKDSSHVFKLDPVSGKLCLQSSLDYEQVPRYQLTVFAHDAGGRTASTLINVLVEDVNDNSPVFDPPTYNITVYGDLPIGTALLTVQAIDHDVGHYGEVRYYVEGAEGLFHVDQNNGRVYSDKPLHSLSGQILDVKIWAKDSGGLTSSIPANIQVQVLDSDKNCPHFVKGLYEFTISEDILPGIIIGTVEAISPRELTYKIISENHGKFILDPKTGKLSVAKEQDADSLDVILLNIEARASDNCASFSQIKIRIHDTNDNAPEFDMTEVETNVAEDFTIHEPFFAVQAIDKDKHENGKVTYELIKSEPACPVIIRPLTGQMLLAASLDYEKAKRYTLTIRAQDQGIPPRASFTTVYLNVLDVNDNAPEFENQLYDLEVPEDAHLMTPLIVVKATDKDSNENANIRYRFIDESVTDFGINSKTGEIFVRQNLDRETTPDYTFLVVAYDKGNPPLSSNASIHIRILDVNDNTPNCTTLDKMRISEDMEPKRVLGQLNAFDPDAGLNGSVVYRLQQLNEFVDVKRNGEVILKRKIRGALKSSFQLAVIAEDQGPKPRPAVCTLFIELDKTESTVKLSEPIERTIHLNINDTVGTEVLHINASNAHSWNIEENSISSYFDAKEGGIFLAQPIEESKFLKPHSLTVNIGDKEGRKLHVTFIIRLHHSSTADNETIVTKLQETTAIGTKILTLAASERSISDEYYSLVRGDPSFELVEGTGNVYLSKRLDYNIASAVQIEVSRNDMMSSSRRKDMTLIFELDDTNNHSPIFAMDNYTFNVLESTPVGALIGRVEAVDDDIGMNGAVKYRFIDAENTFDINVETGEIFLQKTLHHHVKPKYYMTVEAEDSCQQKSERRRKQTVVFINVVDTNDNPPIFLSSNDITIKWPEIFNLSNPIHYFVCSDVDDGSNGEIKYKIIGGNKNNEFAINSTTGALMLKKKISQTMKLTIRAMDVSSTPRFADQSFTIFVNHTSTEWKYFGENSYSFDLNPHVVTGTAIYNFRNEDDESVIFGLLPENLKGFEIGRTDGILRTTGEVIERTHRLIVYTISEEGNTTDYASVIVNIKEDSTSGPKIVQASCGNISIPENRAITDVMRIFPSREASTMDTPFFYHIEGGADSLFFINETSGIISCKELDREKKSEHFLIISVSDNHQPKRADVCTVRVLVRDENDNPPRFSPTIPQLIEITDSVVAPALILKLTAHDPDEGENGKVKFRIVDDPSGTLDIDPDTGDIIFARDYAFKGPEFILKVAIDDCSQTNPLSSERQIRVNWKRTTVGFLRGEPKFLQQKYIATVLEGQPRGTPVIKIDTSNKIFNDVLLTLNIVEGNVDAAFEIDDEGHIRTAEELDAEIQRVYILKIMATGRFIRSPETIVEIHVLDTNDNAPSFPPVRSRKIPENAPVGSHIFSITANDVDQNSVLEYTINPLNDYFYIGRFTGRIYLKKELDFETEQLINVGVQVFDGIHTAKVNFTVEVVDVNDNSPKFSSDMIKINVPISAIGNSIIGQITAIDEDQGSGGEVSYALLDGTKDFQINEKTGQLSLLNRLKKNSVYFVNVQATDNGNPQLSTIATIKLKAVQNAINDKPIFTKEVFNFLVDENHPPHLPFGAVEFQNKRSDECIPKILDEAFMDIFEISNDGQLSLKMPIDRESVKEFKFRIGLKYRDNGLTSSEEEQEFTSIIIQVVDFNDNAPVFGSDSPKVIRLEEKMKKGTIVGRLTATDIDAGDNARIRFRILSGNELGTIRVDQNSGAVIFDHWDDEFLYESPGTNTFNITFIAEDNGAPSLWSVYMAQLVYNIDNWSGSAPMFAVPSYHKYIPESLSIGSVVVKAQAHNKWDYVTKSWKYSISDNDEIFEINTHSGEVILRGQLDHERKSSYEFTVTVEDAHHRSAIVPVQVTVIGVDEFAPMFSKASYTFEIPPKAEIGQRIGQISATDDDIGPDGKVTYSIADEEHTPFIGIDPDSGVLVLKEPFPANRTVEQITVIASSGVTQHSRTIVSLELGTPDSLKNSPILELTKLNKLTVTVAVLFISLLLLLCLILVCIYFKAREQRKPQKQIYSVAKGNVAVMADINRSSPSFAKVPPSLSYERPKTFSLISSNSSDRNSNQLKPSSTHDGFGARSQPDSGIDPDAISINSSVTDYLLQIGITPVKLDHMTRFPRMSKSTTAPERIDPDFGELGDLIYAKVDEVLPTARMAMSSYHPTELSIDSFLPQSHNQPPQNKGLSYHPLTEVFTQISRMQEEQKSSQQ